MTSSSTEILIDKFHLSAGGILMDEKKKRVCLIEKASTGEYLLPKGTKESHEKLAMTARREVFEETGYENDVSPDRLLGILFRPHVGGTAEHHKVVFWYYAALASHVHHEGTQEEHENFSSVWCSLEEAMEKLSFENDKLLVQRAFHFVRLNVMPREVSEQVSTFHWCGPENKCIRLLTSPSAQLRKGFVVVDGRGDILLVLDRLSHSFNLPSDEHPTVGKMLISKLDENLAPFLYQLRLDSSGLMVRQWYFLKLNLEPIADTEVVSRQEAFKKIKESQCSIRILVAAFEKHKAQMHS